MQTNLTLWIGFNIFVLSMLALDLGVFHRRAHAVRVREAVIWSVVWIALAGSFNIILYFGFGGECYVHGIMDGEMLAIARARGEDLK